MPANEQPGAVSQLRQPEEPLPSTGQSEPKEEVKKARAANMFDIRRLIGVVFGVYGAVLTIIGIFGSHAVKTKAAGININLWTGLGMLVFGALMLGWALARPVAPEPEETSGQGSSRVRGAPAT